MRIGDETLIDTHCHFNHGKLSEDLPACIERAAEVGVMQMIVVGYDLVSSAQAVAQAEAYPNVLFAAVGVHPHDAKDWEEASGEQLKKWSDHPQVVAIGEIGLDYHYDFSPREAQFAAFRAQMALAREVGLPVIIHCREAYTDTLQVLAAEGADETGGVMHCWAGTVEEAERTVALGMALGFGGTLTFKNAEEVRAAAQRVPLEALLVETDAPYLAPMPHRGKRNEPAYTRLVAERLAELREMTLPEIARLTTINAHRVFPRLGNG
ncbi:MAG TPA: TatD family hydrolase [Chthonomonadaceae bacterium]|nr:TatD family hydrolase [Chthonomonadaceae bacterium]